MSTFVTLIPPAGRAVHEYLRNPESVPQGFRDCMAVRTAVFVEEQGVPAENEIDYDDERSYHWVVYASVSRSRKNTSSSGILSGQNGALNDENTNPPDPLSPGADGGPIYSLSPVATASQVPVAVIRLIPPPHAPHPAPGSVVISSNEPPSASSPPGTTAGTSLQSPFTARPTSSSSSTTSPTSPTSPTDPHYQQPYIKLSRLATVPAYRGLGLARLLVATAIDWASTSSNRRLVSGFPADPVERMRTETAAALGGVADAGAAQRLEWRGLCMVHAQLSAVRFWKSVGFQEEEVEVEVAEDEENAEDGKNAAGGINGEQGQGNQETRKHSKKKERATWWEEGIEHVGMLRRLELSSSLSGREAR